MNDLRQRLEQLQADAPARLAAAPDAAAVEEVRHALMGRSGELTALIRELGQAAADERPALGRLANEVRSALEQAVADRQAEVTAGALDARLEAERLDMSAPGQPVRIGHLHPTLTVERDFREIFHAFGFEVFEGPEIETEWWNFEALNIPPDHPARDLWDTLYVAEPGSEPPRPADDGTILRTHTSPEQIRAMKALKPPIRAIMPGRQSMGVVGTTLLGIGGSLVGGLIGSLLTRQPYAMTHPTGAGFIGSLIGALLLLGIAGMVANRATPADRGV